MLGYLQKELKPDPKKRGGSASATLVSNDQQTDKCCYISLPPPFPLTRIWVAKGERESTTLFNRLEEYLNRTHILKVSTL